jgi:putative ABC transport system permease protein
MTEPTYYEKQSEGLALFIKAMGLVIAFFFAAGAIIGATITMYSSIATRSREIGTLRALGFSRWSILVSFLLESIALVAMGGVLGVVGSLGMGFVKFSTMNFANWSEITFTFEPTPKILMSALRFSGGMGLLGGLCPAIRAARMSPLQAMRGG